MLLRDVKNCSELEKVSDCIFMLREIVSTIQQVCIILHMSITFNSSCSTTTALVTIFLVNDLKNIYFSQFFGAFSPLQRLQYIQYISDYAYVVKSVNFALKWCCMSHSALQVGMDTWPGLGQEPNPVTVGPLAGITANGSL